MSERTKYILFFFCVLATRLPFISDGYGLDGDAWSVAITAEHIHATQAYEASRLPGNPVHEWLCSVFVGEGYWRLNLLSAIFGSLGVLFFVMSLRALRFRMSFLAGAALSAVPILYISSTVALDYVFGFAFLMAALYAVSMDRSVIAGILLGLAIGCRITSGAMLLPYALMLLQQDGLQRNLWRIFNALFWALVVGIMCYLPSFLVYGSDFLTYYDVPYPSILRVLYRGFIEVWGVVGFAGLVAAVLSLLLPEKMISGHYQFPRSVNIKYVVAWLVALDLYIIAFIKLPMEAGYLLPALPFVLMILGKYLVRPVFAVFCWTLIASPFLLSVSPADRPDAEHPSSLHTGMTLGGESLTIDLLKGPVASFQSRREHGVSYVQDLLVSFDSLKAPSVLVSGQWYNMLVHMNGDTTRGNVLMAPHVTENELHRYLSEGRNIYYLPRQDSLNVRLKGADPRLFGGELYD